MAAFGKFIITKKISGKRLIDLLQLKKGEKFAEEDLLKAIQKEYEKEGKMIPRE